MVVVAGGNAVVFYGRGMVVDDDVEEPVGIGWVSAGELDVGVEDDVLEEIKVLGVVLHVLLEVVVVQKGWGF